MQIQITGNFTTDIKIKQSVIKKENITALDLSVKKDRFIITGLTGTTKEVIILDQKNTK